MLLLFDACTVSGYWILKIGSSTYISICQIMDVSNHLYPSRIHHSCITLLFNYVGCFNRGGKLKNEVLLFYYRCVINFHAVIGQNNATQGFHAVGEFYLLVKLANISNSWCFAKTSFVFISYAYLLLLIITQLSAYMGQNWITIWFSV